MHAAVRTRWLLRGLLASGLFLCSCLPTSAPLDAASPTPNGPTIVPLDPPGGKVEAAELARGAVAVVAVGADGALRVAVEGTAADPPLERVSAQDPTVAALLAFLGLEKATSFAVLGAQNPRCVKVCELVGGDWLCRRVCS